MNSCGSIGATNPTETNRPASAYGRLRKSSRSTTLNTAVVAPIPSAIVTIAVSVNTGLLRKPRAARRRSCQSVSTVVCPPEVPSRWDDYRVLGHSLRPWQRAAKKVDLRDIEVHTPPFGVPHLLGRDLAHRRVRIERHENERRRAVTRVLSLRRAAENSVATIQSRLTGTSPGQLSLPR